MWKLTPSKLFTENKQIGETVKIIFDISQIIVIFCLSEADFAITYMT